MDRRLPGGYGQRKGSDAYLGNSESQYLRETLVPKEGGWLVSPMGDSLYGQQDSTGVVLGADVTLLVLLPPRAAAVSCYEARISVLTSAASSWFETALYRFEDRLFRQVSNTLVRHICTSTGLITTRLPIKVDILPDTLLFLGCKTNNGTVEVSGFFPGPGSTPRVVRARTVSHSGSLASQYTQDQTAISHALAGIPDVAYLSQTASSVI